MGRRVRRRYDGAIIRSGVQSDDVPFMEYDRDALVWTRDEFLIDITGNRHGYNPCTHTKTTVSVQGTPTAWVSGTGSSSLTFNLGPKYIPPEGGVGVPAPSYSDVQDFVQDALHAAVTQIPEQIKIANFLWELKDMGADLFRKWQNILKDIAAGHLTIEFAIKPFLADCRRLETLIQDLRKRLKFLRDTNGKRTYIRSRRSIPDLLDVGAEPSPIIGDPFYGWDFPLGYELKPVLEKSSCKLTSLIVLKRELVGLDSALAELRALEAALGLNNLVATLWEATPFSFLVEWFVNLEHVIDRIAVEPFVGTTVVLASFFSVKSTAVYGAWVYQQPTLIGASLVYQPKRVGTILAKSYTRQLGLPLAEIPVFLEGGTDARQNILIGAMIIANAGLR